MTAADRPTLARLREVAVTATPGPWRVVSQVNAAVVGNTETIAGGKVPVADCWGRPASDRKPDAEHIATFDPPTVTALLDEIEALRDVVAAVSELADEWETAHGDPPVDPSHISVRHANRLRAALDGAPIGEERA